MLKFQMTARMFHFTLDICFIKLDLVFLGFNLCTVKIFLNAFILLYVLENDVKDRMNDQACQHVH